MGRLAIRVGLTWLLLVLLCSVGGQASAHFTVQPATPTVIAGNLFQVTVTAYDSRGNIATGYKGSPIFTTSARSYNYCAGCSSGFVGGIETVQLSIESAGAQTLTFTDGPIKGTGTVTVLGGPPSNYVISAPASAISGTPFSFNVTGYDSYSNVSSYTGPANFSSSDGLAKLPPSGSSTVTNGVGTFQATLMTPGNQSLNIQTELTPSFVGGRTTVNVVRPAPALVVSLAVSSTSPPFGVPVTLTATISGGISPTGTITFKNGSTVLGVVPLSGPTANLTTKSLSAGAHVIVAAYSGDARNRAATSAPVSVDVGSRINPTTDTSVVSLVAATVGVATRLSQTQISNISNRLDQIHNELDIPPFCPRVDKGSSGGGGSPNGAPAATGGANQTAFGDLEQSGQAMAYASGPSSLPESESPAGRAIGALTSQLPGAFEALDKNGDLPFHIWSSAAVAFGAVNSGGGAYDNHFTNAGLTIGFDRNVAEGLTMGVAFGGGLDDSVVGTDGTKLAGTNYGAEIYGSYRLLQHTFLDASVGYTVMRFDLKRWSQAGGVMLEGVRGGSDTFGSFGVTQQLEWGELKVAPYSRLDVIRVNLASYSESGSDYWALAYGRMTSTTYTGALGSRISYPIPVSWGELMPTARLEYDHAFGGGYNQSLSYANLPGSSYSLPGTDLTRDLATGGVGLQAETAASLRIDLEYLVSGWPRQVIGQEIRATISQTF